MVFFSLNGCVLQSSQLERFSDAFFKKANQSDLSEWQLNYGDYESVVFPIEFDNGILFANRDGDYVFFDGRNIQFASGFGEFKFYYKNQFSELLKTFNSSDKSSSAHFCSPWVDNTSEQGILFTQQCGNIRDYSNSVRVLFDGTILEIKQILDDTYNPVILTKTRKHI